MAGEIKFVCTQLQGTQKQGILKPDADGYYTTVLGALNILNSAGMYYVAEGVKELFEQSAPLMRRTKRGASRGEVGHPQRCEGETMNDFIARYCSIDDKNICAHFSEFWLDFQSVKGLDGKPVIAIMGKVTPSGIHGDFLKRAFENGKENVCFSIRSMTYDYTDKGLIKRIIKNVITFDWVNEPGIYVAEKYRSPAMESIAPDVRITERQMRRALETKQSALAMESIELNAPELFQSLGWELTGKQKQIFADWK